MRRWPAEMAATLVQKNGPAGHAPVTGLPYPHTGLEEWLHVRLPAQPTAWTLAQNGLGDEGLHRALAPFLASLGDAPRLVLENGGLHTALSDWQGVTGLDVQAVSWHEENVPPESATDYFASLSARFAPQEVVLRMKKGAAPAASLTILSLASQAVEGEWVLPRLRIHVEREAELSVALMWLEADGGWWLPEMDVSLEQGACLRIEEARPAAAGCVLSGWTVHQGRDSRFHHNGVNLGAGPGRCRMALSLDDENAEVHLAALNLVAQDRQMHHFLRVHHRAPHCLSRQVFKSVLMDTARTSFDGLVHVYPGAAGTDAHQLNQNLMLSPTARADANPRLEIFADDVKCAHGATVGRLNEEEVFYLQTRGLGRAQAQQLLTLGFAREMLGQFTSPVIRDWAERQVLPLLGAGGKDENP